MNVPLTPPNSVLSPRTTQVDFSASKAFNFNRFRVSPKMDVFNAFNSDDYQNVQTLQYGAAAYGRPTTILQGRIVRVGADVSW